MFLLQISILVCKQYGFIHNHFLLDLLQSRVCYSSITYLGRVKFQEKLWCRVDEERKHDNLILELVDESNYHEAKPNGLLIRGP